MATIDHPIFIRAIRQKDKHWFTIEWSDGKMADYHLGELQRHCPCARCRGEKKAEQLIDDVTAIRIISIGDYALQIFFIKGCSKGIYPFQMLREMNHQYET